MEKFLSFYFKGQDVHFYQMNSFKNTAWTCVCICLSIDCFIKYTTKLKIVKTVPWLVPKQTPKKSQQVLVKTYMGRTSLCYFSFSVLMYFLFKKLFCVNSMDRNTLIVWVLYRVDPRKKLEFNSFK